tara:strand:- start:625 stop:1035 length:411 start_codon:yes stop_codon:yes gene_type:complete
LSRLFLILFSTLALNTWASDCADKGFSSVWEFNQSQETIELKEIVPMQICDHFSKMINSNIKIDLLKGDEVVYTLEVLWPERVVFETFEKDQIRGEIKQIKDSKILKFPIDPKSIDSYKVYHLKKKKLLSEGEINE